MKKMLIPLLVAAVLAAALPAAAQQQCYADYKAKRDAPLRLHYGVMQLTQGCTPNDARTETAGRLQAAGWVLLNVISVFGPDGLSERKADAGPYYLRF